MSQFGGKDSKRHFTVIMGNKEYGLYVSSSPSSAAKKAVTKLCSSNKSKKVEFSIREITQGSKKKIYGPYEGHIEKLKMPIELKGRVIKYKPIAKLSAKLGVKKGGGPIVSKRQNKGLYELNSNNNNNFVNPAAGPAQNYHHPHNPELSVNSRNNEQDFLLGTAPELLPNNENSNNKIKFPVNKLKARNKTELKALVKYFNIINKYYKMWSEYYSLAAASQNELIGMLRSELLETFKNITDRDIEESFKIIKENSYFLRDLNNYIVGSIQRHPTWVRDLTVDILFTPASLTNLGYIDHNDQNLNTSVKLPIPDYLIGNWSNLKKHPPNPSFSSIFYKSIPFGRPYKSIGITNPVQNYKQSLERLANKLKSVGIEWNDRTDIFVNSVRYFLQKYYQNPTPEQLDIAVKVVRMSLLPTKSHILYKQIFNNNF